MHRRAAHASAALLSALTLTACADRPAPVRIQVERLQVSPALLLCSDEPAPPSDAELNSDAEMMIWVETIRLAGNDCRGKLAALRSILDQKRPAGAP